MAVVVDFVIVDWRVIRWIGWDLREVVASATVLAFAIAASELRDGESFGFRWTPQQNWQYWIKLTLFVGVILGSVLLVYFGVAFGLMGSSLPAPLIRSESQFLSMFLWMCVAAPIYEEIVYRLAFTSTAAAWCGPRAAIVLGGVLFAGAHVWRGNPSPENLLGGFILSWAYLKSGTIVVPIALHSLGNFCAYLMQVGYFLRVGPYGESW
ncbi:MAG: CPBP family intramembrane glutamic endopeptidase [Planctomycetales bacterium]